MWYTNVVTIECNIKDMENKIDAYLNINRMKKEMYKERSEHPRGGIKWDEVNSRIVKFNKFLKDWNQ